MARSRRAFVMPLMDVDQMNLGPPLPRGPELRLPTWTRTKTKGSKDPCAAITPYWGTAIKPEVFRQVSIMPYAAIT